MPITGILDGFNEQRLVEQRLADESQLNQMRAQEVAIRADTLKRRGAVEDVLAKVFQGQLPDAIGSPDRDEQLTQRMEQAVPMLMSVDPETGLQMATASSQMRARKTQERTRQQAEEIKARDEQGAALNAIQGQEGYQQGWQDYLARGGKQPSWYTGDWEQDAPKVKQLARSAMTTSEQLMADRRAELTKHEADTAAANAEKARLAAEVKQRELELRQQAGEIKALNADRQALDSQERRNRLKVATKQDQETALIAVRERMDAGDFPEVPAPAARELANRAASRAKKRVAEEDGNYSDMLAEELDNIAKEEVQPKKEFELFSPTTWGSKAKIKRGGEPAPASPASKPSGDQKGLTKSIGGAVLKSQVEATGVPYEPEKYEYKLVDGQIARRLK